MKKLTSETLRQMYLDFFASKGHKIIASASLIPENDPSVLFTTAGMHPLVPYLLGEKHPAVTDLPTFKNVLERAISKRLATHLTLPFLKCSATGHSVTILKKTLFLGVMNF